MINKAHIKTFIISDSFCLTIYQQYLLALGITNQSAFENIHSCLSSIMEEQPKVIFIDFGSDAETAIDSVKEIKKLYPEIYVVVLNNPEEENKVAASLRYGAFTNIIKGEKEQESFQNVLLEIYNTCELLNKYDIRIIKSNRPIN
jgi:DNA-binding NarL/FixJ family response regulator